MIVLDSRLALTMQMNVYPTHRPDLKNDIFTGSTQCSTHEQPLPNFLGYPQPAGRVGVAAGRGQGPCVGTPGQPMLLLNKVKVHMDHTNLLLWKNPGDHNRRVAQWHAELMEYNFKLVHIFRKKNGHMDTLSRHPDYDQGDNDNKNLTVLPPKFFSKVYAKYVGTRREPLY